MQRFRKLASMMGVEHAIILAPMAGGTSTPALVAAVSNAGGLGSLGAGYMTPDDIAKAVAEIQERTDKPFAVNLFAGGYDGTGSSDTAAMLKLIAPWHERLGLPPPVAPAGSLPPFEQQVEVVLRSNVPVFSFTFGIPAADFIRRMKDRGIKLVGAATTVAEARALEQAGVDAIVAQGSEAGADRDTFIASLEDSLVGTIALVPQMVDGLGSGDRVRRNNGWPRNRCRRGARRKPARLGRAIATAFVYNRSHARWAIFDSTAGCESSPASRSTSRSRGRA
jgi:nitronate monooxygenase